MAEGAYTLTVDADFSQVLAGFAKIKQEAPAVGSAVEKGLGDGVDRNVNRFSLLEGAVAGVAATLTNGVVNAAQNAITAVGNLINEFGALDTEIRKAAGAAGEDGGYEKIAESVNKVGIEAAGTTVEVAQLATELVRGGMTIDQANESLGAIVRGAEATGTSFSSMGSVVSASLKGFGLDATEATRVVDALVQGANASATSVDGMGQAFKYAAPVAKILGVSVEGLGTAIGLMANAGIDASEAGTTLRNGLSKLASAAPETGGKMVELSGQAKIAADTMKELNINIYNTDGTLKPMQETILTLKGAFDKLNPSTKIRIAANLFGGEDDGAKWLALLGQSQEEINKMADAMANTQGASDKARDAMQGFEMKMKQLQGTLDSIGTGIGKVAATALLPFVDAANFIVSAFTALPTPIKDTLAAVALLVGGVTAATAAFVVFRSALQLAAVQSAITAIGNLAVGIGATLVGGISSAIAIIPGLITQLSLLGQVNVTTAISALATAFRTTLSQAIASAASALTSFVTYLTSVSFGSFIASVGAMVRALLPLALAVGAATLAITTWQTILKDAKQVQEDFKDSQEKAVKIADDLKVALNDQATAATNAKNGWQLFLDYASESMALQELQNQFSGLQAKFTAVQMAANTYYNTIKENSSLTAAEATKAKEYVDALRSQEEIIAKLIPALKSKAEQAEKDGDPTLAQAYTERAAQLEVELDVNKRLITAYENKIGKHTTLKSNAEEAITLSKEQAKAEEDLNRIIREAPVRAVDQQLAVGNQLLSLTQSLAALEQSRYAITGAHLSSVLSKLQEQKASESEIDRVKRQIDENDKLALAAKYAALQQEQTLQAAILKLTQDKALIEADLEIYNQRIEILKADNEIRKAINENDKTAEENAKSVKTVQESLLGVLIEKKNNLIQIQPIEEAIATVQAETAINSIKAEAASKNFKINADGTITPLKNIGDGMDRIATLTASSAEEAERYKNLANDAGLSVGIAKDGTIVLGQSWSDVNTEVQNVNNSIESTGSKAGDLETNASGIKTALQNALGPAAGLVDAFTGAGDQAPRAQTAAESFTASLSAAAAAGQKIEGSNLDTYMSRVSGSTGGAATAAQRFYEWLNKAAGLPAARWSGGPVEGGTAYQVNELGQEAFLSAGRLSLITAPAGGTWRAPSSGVVVPAGITAQLQAQGALPVRAARLTGGGSAIAEQAVVGAQQAVVLGKLEQAVDRLARREWNVNVTMRQGPTGSQVIRHLNRLL